MKSRQNFARRVPQSRADLGGLGRPSRVALQFSVLTLVANLVSGVVIARTLAPPGRGELTAIITLPNVGTWFFGMGASEALAYFSSRDPAGRPRLVTSWLATMLPLGLLATLVIEALIAPALHAQSHTTLVLARLWAPTVFLPMYAEIFYGSLLGAHRYTTYNAARAFPSIVNAAGVSLLASFGALSVATALGVTAFGSLLTTALLGRLVVRGLRVGRGRPLLPRASLWYGLKAHGANLSSTINARLDLIMLPAFITARSVGLYAVATTVSWILVTFSSAIYPIVMPMAVAQAQRGPRTIILSLYLVLGLGCLAGAPIVVLAPVALRVVYGQHFAPAAIALRILIPGSVLLGATQILWSGLFAANRPFTAAVTQLPGVVITVLGLVLFLKAGGIAAAAVVSTLAYSVVFLTSLVCYCRVVDMPVGLVLRPRALRAQT